jgi:hypothetical protein
MCHIPKGIDKSTLWHCIHEISMNISWFGRHWQRTTLHCRSKCWYLSTPRLLHKDNCHLVWMSSNKHSFTPLRTKRSKTRSIFSWSASTVTRPGSTVCCLEMIKKKSGPHQNCKISLVWNQNMFTDFPASKSIIFAALNSNLFRQGTFKRRQSWLTVLLRLLYCSGIVVLFFVS